MKKQGESMSQHGTERCKGLRKTTGKPAFYLLASVQRKVYKSSERKVNMRRFYLFKRGQIWYILLKNPKY